MERKPAAGKTTKVKEAREKTTKKGSAKERAEKERPAKRTESVQKGYVYMLRCKDGSLYTGMTTELSRRFEEHCSGSSLAAKYTKAHPPLFIAAAFETADLHTARSLEWHIKKLTKDKKEELVSNAGPGKEEPDKEALAKLFGEAFSSDKVRILSESEIAKP